MIKTSSSRTGFTLVELLVVIAIISILAGMLLPALQKAQEAARRTDCTNREKQFATAFFMYAGDFEGYFPPPSDSASYGGNHTINGYWFIGVGPYLGYERSILGCANPYIQYNGKSIFYCPSASPSLPSLSIGYSGTVAGYAMNRFIPPADNYGDWQKQMITYPVLSMIHRPGQKLLVADSRQMTGLGSNWEFTQVTNPAYRYTVDTIRHDTGTNMVYCDGHVKWLGEAEILAKVADDDLF